MTLVLKNWRAIGQESYKVYSDFRNFYECSKNYWKQYYSEHIDFKLLKCGIELRQSLAFLLPTEEEYWSHFPTVPLKKSHIELFTVSSNCLDPDATFCKQKYCVENPFWETEEFDTLQETLEFIKEVKKEWVQRNK